MITRLHFFTRYNQRLNETYIKPILYSITNTVCLVPPQFSSSMKTAFGDPIPEESMRVFFFRAIIKFPQSSFFPNDARYFSRVSRVSQSRVKFGSLRGDLIKFVRFSRGGFFVRFRSVRRRATVAKFVRGGEAKSHRRKKLSRRVFDFLKSHFVSSLFTDAPHEKR